MLDPHQISLGRDAAWRREMWRRVPERASAVLDLCTGSGTSLPGLRRPGRLVLGMDVSLAMLERASQGRRGWAPRLVCADAFRLPLRDGGVTSSPSHPIVVVTIGFAIDIASRIFSLVPPPSRIGQIKISARSK